MNELTMKTRSGISKVVSSWAGVNLKETSGSSDKTSLAHDGWYIGRHTASTGLLQFTSDWLHPCRTLCPKVKAFCCILHMTWRDL